MARRRRVRRLRLSVQQNVTQELRRIDVGLKGPTMDVGLLEAADYMAGIARARAPRRTGTLASGIYTANAYRNNHPGGRAVQRLKRPPKPGTAVVVAGVFYQRFYEYGRKRRRAAQAGENGAAGRRGVARQPRRPFFRQALQAGLPGARAIIAKRAKRVIEANG
jgi:hypothetical protein